MKKILMSFILCIFFLGVTLSAGAMVTTGQVSTQYEPNLVNLWSDEPFGDAIWSFGTYWQSSDGYWAQWFTMESFDVNNVLGTQNWDIPEETELNLDLQECWYDWDTGIIEESWNYAYHWDGKDWLPGNFGDGGGLVDCPTPVAIPASVLLLGSGLFGLIAIGFRRRKSTAA